jgi:predicted RNA-binding protein with PIN domain
MDDYLIVDGYNMIGAWPELSKLANIELEEARDKLIQMLAEYQGYSGMSVILVFDAHQVPGLGGQYRQSRLDIRYTKAKETADECIERLVTELAHRRRNLYVATSDFVEQHVTFGKGALRLSARELLTDIKESRKKIQQQISEHKLVKRNTFDSTLSNDLKSTLEKWRRGKK